MMEMNDNRLLQSFSRPRINAYGQSTEAHNLAAHTFNILLAEALYPLLQLIELGLRNNIDHAFKEKFGSNWLSQEFLHEKEKELVDKIRKELNERKISVYHDTIIAELNYGFWTALLKPSYESSVWQQLISKVFVRAPRKIRNRDFIFKRFNEIRLLRNRVFHHEKILCDTLPVQHRKIHEAINWLSGDLYGVAFKIDRFPKLYHDQGLILADLRSFHGISTIENGMIAK
jgi:hypothetical protein